MEQRIVYCKDLKTNKVSQVDSQEVADKFKINLNLEPCIANLYYDLMYNMYEEYKAKELMQKKEDSATSTKQNTVFPSQITTIVKNN